MAEADKILKILLQVQSDVADLQKVTGGLDQTTGKLKEVGDAASKASPLLKGLFAGLGIGLLSFLKGIPDEIERMGEEVLKLSEKQRESTVELDRQVGKWIQLARVAQNAGDVIKLSSQIGNSLEESSRKLSAMGKDQMGFLMSSLDYLTHGLVALSTGPLTQAREALRASAEQELRTNLAAFNQLTDVANESAAAFARIKSLPVAQGVAEVKSKVTELRSEVAALSQQRFPPDGGSAEELQRAAAAAVEFGSKSAELQVWINLLGTLQGALQKTTDALRDMAFNATAAMQSVQNQIATATAEASGNEQKILDTKLEQLRVSTQIRLQEAGNDPVAAARMAEELVNAERARAVHASEVRSIHTSDSAGLREQHQDVLAFMAQENALIRESRQNQQLIDQDPFLSVDQKSAALLQFIPQQIDAINAEITQGRAAIAKTVLDPAQLTQANAKIKQAQFEVALLGQKMKAASFGGTIRADLTSWANQFGTTARQVGNIITNTLGTAINGVSQALTNAIFQTGSWKEAWNQAAQAIVQNIITIALQWAVSRAVMALLNIAFGKAESATINAEATQAAAAWAPAATAASIASYGAAAGFGLTAYLAAIAIGTASTVASSSAGGGFEAGGFTGAGASHEPAGIVHRGEYVFPKSIVDRKGAAWFDGLQLAINRPGYERGGSVGGGSRSGGGRASGGDVHVFNFTDPKKLEQAYMRSTAARKMIIDTVNGAGGHLRS